MCILFHSMEWLWHWQSFLPPLQTVMEDKPLSLHAKVTGTPRPEVTWYRNNKELVTTPNVKVAYEDDTCSLIIKKMTMDLEGQYKCVARNPAGTTDIVAKVTVEGKVKGRTAAYICKWITPLVHTAK